MSNKGPSELLKRGGKSGAGTLPTSHRNLLKGRHKKSARGNSSRYLFTFYLLGKSKKLNNRKFFKPRQKRGGNRSKFGIADVIMCGALRRNCPKN